MIALLEAIRWAALIFCCVAFTGIGLTVALALLTPLAIGKATFEQRLDRLPWLSAGIFLLALLFSGGLELSLDRLRQMHRPLLLHAAAVSQQAFTRPAPGLQRRAGPHHQHFISLSVWRVALATEEPWAPASTARAVA